MARHSKHAHLYEAFQKFINTCLLSDRSLLWPYQNFWTPEIVTAVKTAMADNPLSGKITFEEKLQKQMMGVPSEGWGVLADIYYVYSLVSRTLKEKTKRGFIAFAAKQASFPLPQEDDTIWTPLKQGFTSTGQQYNLKYPQFFTLLRFVDFVKHSQRPRTILENPEELQRVLDSAVQEIHAGHDIRHAVLYLAFPDRYESMISTRDKEAIVKVYADRLTEDAPQDLDKRILLIRQSIAPEKDVDGEPFQFNLPEIRNMADKGLQTYPPKNSMPVTPQADTVAGPALPSPAVQQSTMILKYTRNLILYGPPGTGKTFLAQLIARELTALQRKQKEPDEILLQEIAESHPFYSALALGFFLSDPAKSLSVDEIMQMPIIQARFKIRPVNYPREMVWGTLQNHTAKDSETVKANRKFGPAIFDKDRQSRWSLTARGKEYVEQSLIDAFHKLRKKPDETPRQESSIFSVTFHQSYSYEDFVEGIRPKASAEETGALAYEVTPGIFRRICARASANPENTYVLLIDEINRGNIAKIFGEIITLVEDDKRSGENNALTATLPYSGDNLSVPGNLYLIGTMNTADRSIALLDVALRRRFAFMEVMPDPDLFGDVSVESEESGAIVHLGNLLRSLNTKIVESLGRNYQIGHSYFWKVSQVPQEQRLAALEFAWNYQVLPLLEEYFHSQRNRLMDLLAPLVKGFEDGADPETVEIPRATGEDLLTTLARLSEDN